MKYTKASHQGGFTLSEMLFTLILFGLLSAASLSVVGFTKDRNRAAIRATADDWHSWLVAVRGAATRVGVCRIQFATSSDASGTVTVEQGGIIASVEPAVCGDAFRAPEAIMFRLNQFAAQNLVNAGPSSAGTCPDLTITSEGLTLLCGDQPPAGKTKVFTVGFAAPQVEASQSFPVVCAGVVDFTGTPLLGRGNGFSGPCEFEFL